MEVSNWKDKYIKGIWTMIQDYKSYVQSLGLILEYYTKTEIFSIIWWLRFILRWQHWSDALSIMEVDIASSCTCICDIKHCKVVCPEQCLTITCAFNFHIIKNLWLTGSTSMTDWISHLIWQRWGIWHVKDIIDMLHFSSKKLLYKKKLLKCPKS